jgi:hypothetical protein
MRTFAQKPKTAQPITSASIAHVGANHDSNAMVNLQPTVGNQAVPRLMQSNGEERDAALTGTAASFRFGQDFSRIPASHAEAVPLQTKLAVDTPGGTYEQEADRVAEQVMRMPEQRLQAVSPWGGACPMCRAEHVHPAREPLRTRRLQTGNVGHLAVPPVVNETLESLGRPLDPDPRAFMESRFGHDLSRVRIHADATAAASARALNARAYTAGRDVVFAAGQYAPGTHIGTRLLAHELTHVLQQTGMLPPSPAARTSVPYLQRTPAGGGVGQPVQARSGNAADRREFAREALRFLRDQGEFFALQTGSDLATQLRHMRTTVENGLAMIAGDSSAAGLEADLRSAYRDAVRTTLMARTRTRPGEISVRTPPTLQELYERHRNDILLFGLPQASADRGAAELSAELAAPLPARPSAAQRRRHAAIQSARQRLRVITSQVDFQINDLFSTRVAATTIPLPEHTTVRFSSTIPASLQHGLRNVAGVLMRGRATLTANTTVLLALDLTPFGGGYDAYRFTRLDLGRRAIEVLIERQGTIGIEGLRTEQRATLQQRFDRLGFRRGGGFRQDEFDQVLIGVTEVPEAQLASLRNLRFERQAADPEHPRAAADYDQTTHTVRVFDRAYSGGMMRQGRPGRVLTFAAHSIVHELGHALDLTPLRTTAAATATAQQALLAEFGTGGTGYSIPHPTDPERGRYDELQRGLRTATAAERAARGRSGARWSRGANATVTDDLARGARQPAFRAAALRDGGPAGRRMPTTYPDPESVWQEYFAESFALYQTAPDVLQRLRPNVYRYMQGEFPR